MVHGALKAKAQGGRRARKSDTGRSRCRVTHERGFPKTREDDPSHGVGRLTLRDHVLDELRERLHDDRDVAEAVGSKRALGQLRHGSTAPRAPPRPPTPAKAPPRSTPPTPPRQRPLPLRRGREPEPPARTRAGAQEPQILTRISVTLCQVLPVSGVPLPPLAPGTPCGAPLGGTGGTGDHRQNRRTGARRTSYAREGSAASGRTAERARDARRRRSTDVRRSPRPRGQVRSRRTEVARPHGAR